MNAATATQSITPVCSYYLVKQGTPNPFLGYSESSLKRCTRCKGAYYMDGGAQKLQWKIHKKNCKPSSLDTTKMDLDHCTKALKSALYGGSPDLYFIIKRVRGLFDNGAENSDMAAFHLHSIARGLMSLNTSLLLGIVACPYMSSLLFGEEEDLLSTKYRLVKNTKLAKYNGRPSDEFLEDIEDETEKEEVTLLVEQYDKLDDSWGQPSSMSFCYLYFNLIVASTIQGQLSHSSTHDGNGTMRGGNPKMKSPETLLSTAALRRAMELWTDPHVLASCGDAMAPAASLAVTAVEYYRVHNLLCEEHLCNAHELVPGLAIDHLAMTCMKEILDGAGSASYSSKLLKGLKDICGKVWDANCPWRNLPIERRATFAIAFYDYVENADNSSFSSYGRGVELPDNDDMNQIFRIIVGLHNPIDTTIAGSVWKTAAEDGEFIGVHGSGCNYRSRAFFYYLLRSESDGWEGMDVTKLIKEFEDIPRIHKAPDDPKVKEKDECFRLAEGDKRHDEMNRIFSS
mmetsp:Transcript_14057/g.21089  ORF Transcript_14057/g.21089 Transcript_14057/m.21089 type:complete len:513 (+) Transcript_14057:192-1730(+)